MNQMRNEQVMRVWDLMNVEAPDNDDSKGLGHAFFTAEAMPLKYKHKHPKTTTRGSCREYTAEKIEKLFELIIDEGYNAKYAVLLTGIKVRTTQIYLKMYNNDAERRLSGTYNNLRGRPLCKWNEFHSGVLTKFIGNNSTVISQWIEKSAVQWIGWFKDLNLNSAPVIWYKAVISPWKSWKKYLLQNV